MKDFERARKRWVYSVVVSGALVVAALATATTATSASAVVRAKQPQTEPAMTGTSGQRTVNGVAPYEKGFVAVGYEADSKGHVRATVWTVPKPGGTYTRVPDSSFDGDFAVSSSAGSDGRITESSIASVTAVGNELLGGGYAQQLVPQDDGTFGSTPHVPAAFYSQDGKTWQTVTLPVPDNDLGTVEAVNYQSQRFVAVGSVATVDNGTAGASLPAAWYSDDGVTWQMAPGVTDSVSTSGAIEGVGISGAKSSPKFVAVGRVGSGAGGEIDGAVWTSDDGATWTLQPETTALGKGDGYDQSIESVFGVGESDGFIAAGEEGKTSSLFIPTTTAVIWRSKDGIHWTRSKRDDKQFASTDKQRDSTSLHAVVEPGGYYLVVGDVAKSTNKDTQPRFRAWSSNDGTHWALLDVQDSTDKVDSTARGVEGLGKHYEIVGAVQNNGNVWSGTY